MSNVDNFFEQPKDGKDNHLNLNGTWLIDGVEVTQTAEKINDLPNLNGTTNIQFDTTSTSECLEGNMGWNAEDGTAQIGMPGGNVCGQILQENLIRVTNKSGALIENGKPVYISGAAGNNIWVDLADAADPDNNRKTLAIATEEIIDNQKGFVTTFGFVRGFDTDTFSEGDELFVAVGGGLTKTKPALPNGIVRVGFCTRSSSEEGSMFVTIATKSVKDILTDSGDLTIKTEAEKTLVLDQPVWDDLSGALIGSRLDTASGRLDYDFFNGGVSFAANARYPDEPIIIPIQARHKMLYGTGAVAKPHFHWLQEQAARPNFLLGYKITNYGTATIKESDFSNYTLLAPVADAFTYTSGVLAQITAFPEIDISTIGISASLDFAFFRDSANASGLFAGADPVGTSATVKYSDSHVKIDTAGSRQEFIK